MSGKSQDDIVSMLRNVDVGGVVRLKVSRQTSDDLTEQPTTGRAFDSTDDSSHREPTSSSAPPGETKEKRSSNGASSPILRCLTTKTDENDNPIDDGDLHVELIELSIAVGDDETEASSGLGVSIKGISSGHEDHGLFIKKIIEGRAAAKVGVRQRCSYVRNSIFFVRLKKVKAVCSASWKTHSELRSVTCHMESQCYLPPNTSERAPP